MLKFRLGSALALLGILAALIFARYAQLAFASSSTALGEESLEGERGRIVDRNGLTLAMDVPKYDISVWKPSADKAAFESEIPELAVLTGMPADSIRNRFKDGSQNFFYLARRLPADKATVLIAAKKMGKFKGVQVEEISGRLYPEGRLASHLIGFTGEGNVGLDGIEVKYNAELNPKPRKTEDGTGRLADPSIKLPQGDRVFLSIDANLQHMIEDILEDTVKANGAEAALAVAMDVHSGELLCYAAEPGFDPNNYSAYDAETRRDLLSLYSYEPGSVFKLFSMASILDMGAITPNTIFDCDGAYRKTLPSGEKIIIKDLGVYGKQNLAGVLALSSNAGVGYASDRVTEQDLYQRLMSFGFGTRTGVGLSGESPGSLREPEKWSGRSKPTIAIGQEVMVSALQMISAAAAIANGGLLLKPTTVGRIESADGELLFQHEPQVLRRVVSETSAKAILDAMEHTASLQGTGWRAKVPDIRMAVKTGTAQMIDPKTRAYSDKDYIASTLGIFPADKPRIALYIVIIKPRGASYLGGQIAAPVLRQAAEAVLSTLDIERGKTPVVVHGGTLHMPEEKEASVGETMPDLTGYSKRSLLPLLERKDLRVSISGDGYVVSQQPAPGATISQGSTITLRLK
ncbi:MAG: penicillin-binding protein [Spirochaetia bacterium]|jgi:cell division protein FtsI (penicillin-binding protein 3)|nr:penicillin-binding protein [Spirochaetia bacterium]